MTCFKEFVKKLSKEIKGELPGFSAQKLMDPIGNRSLMNLDYSEKTISPKKSAVLILIYPGNKPMPYKIYPESQHLSCKIALILRPENEHGNHAGQISFPGGGIHKLDTNLSETALRETEEEIGVNRTSVSILGPLTPLYIPVSNYIVYPFVGSCSVVPEFKIHPPEVQELVEVKVAELISEKNKKSVERFIKLKNAKMQVPCYEIQGKVIWGATAMIIAEFSEIIKRIK